VKLLYANGASCRDILQTAAESSAEGRLEIMKFVLDQRADINAVKWRHDPRSYEDYELLALGTALHYAVRHGYADRVEMLLKRGARPDVVDSTGYTALDYARMSGYEDMARMLSNWPTSGEDRRQCA